MSVAAGGVSVRAAPGLDISADSSFEDEEAENTALQRRQQQQQGGGGMSPQDPTVQLNNRAVVRPPIAAPSGPVRSAAVTLAPVEPPHQVTPPPQDMGRVGGAFESLSTACEVIRVANRSYLRLGCVGRGGSSRVYRVLGEDLAVYALKRVRLSRMEPGAVDTYRNEIALMRRLAGSRHIVSLVDAEVDWGAKCIHMVMELGQADLNAIVQQEKDRCTKHAAAAAGALSTAALPIAQPQGFMCMDENLLRLVWAQMLSAVDTIHCARIVHGDLKPANFVFVEGTLKLIDFGIAKALSADTTNIVRDSQVGTLNYMSPEAICAVDQRQHGGTAGLMSGGASLLKLGRASDIWSLGCILYQMVYGRTPFAELSLIHKLQAICDPNFSIAFPPISPANGALLDTIRSCLQRDPAKRPSITGPGGLLEQPFLRPNAAVAAAEAAAAAATSAAAAATATAAAAVTVAAPAPGSVVLSSAQVLSLATALLTSGATLPHAANPAAVAKAVASMLQDQLRQSAGGTLECESIVAGAIRSVARPPAAGLGAAAAAAAAAAARNSSSSAEAAVPPPGFSAAAAAAAAAGALRGGGVAGSSSNGANLRTAAPPPVPPSASAPAPAVPPSAAGGMISTSVLLAQAAALRRTSPTGGEANSDKENSSSGRHGKVGAGGPPLPARASGAPGAGGLAAVLHAGMHERFARVAAYRPSAVDVTADMSVGGGEDATFG